MRFQALLLISVFLLFTACQEQNPGPAENEEITSLNDRLIEVTTFGVNLSPDEIKNIGDQALELYEVDEIPEALIISKIAEGLLLPDDRTKGVSLFLEALALSEDLSLEFYMGMLYELIGKDYAIIGKHEDARELYWRAIRIQEKTQSDRLGHLYNFIAMESTMIGETDSVLHLHQTAKEIFQKRADLRSIIATNDQLIQVHIKNENFEKAIGLGRESVTVSEDVDGPWKAIAWQCLGYAHRAAGNYEEALESFDSSLVFSDGSGINTAHFSRIHKARTLYEMGRQEDALAMIDLEFELISATNYSFKKDHQSELLDMRANILGDLNRPKDALASFKEAKKLSDEIRAENERREDIREASRVAIYDMERNLRQNENQLAENRNTINKVLIGSSVLLILLTFSIIIYLQKRKASQKIQAKNEIINKSLKERESLLKEIHHRVKNNLQIIASLLYLQSGKFENEDYKKVLEEGQGRVRSMALIHQKLYENEDLKNIPFDEYLMELVTEIRSSFGPEMKKVSIDINAKNIEFDIDTAIPLGLIVNEMATNAFKYAFNNLDSGSFSISIHQSEGEYVIKIQDDGQGIPESVDIRKVKSLGLRLVRMLSQQLEADFHFETGNGTSFELKFVA